MSIQQILMAANSASLKQGVTSSISTIPTNPWFFYVSFRSPNMQLAVDSIGNSYLSATCNITNFNIYETTLIKLSPEGTVIWTIVFKGDPLFVDGVSADIYKLLVYKNRLFVVGMTYTDWTFSYISCIDTEYAEILWTRQFTKITVQQYGDENDAEIWLYGASVTKDGGIVVAGEGDLNGEWVGYVIKFDSNGFLVWSKALLELDIYGFVTLYDCVIDNDDNVYVVGEFDYTSGICIHKISPSGDLIWSKNIGFISTWSYLSFDSKTDTIFLASTNNVLMFKPDGTFDPKLITITSSPTNTDTRVLVLSDSTLVICINGFPNVEIIFYDRITQTVLSETSFSNFSSTGWPPSAVVDSNDNVYLFFRETSGNAITYIKINSSEFPVTTSTFVTAVPTVAQLTLSSFVVNNPQGFRFLDSKINIFESVFEKIYIRDYNYTIQTTGILL
jgi:hypothetical protein